MATRKDIEKAREKLDREIEAYEEVRFLRKFCSWMGLGGIVCLAYVGSRALCGADFSTIIASNENPHNLIQFLDTFSACLGPILTSWGILGGFFYYLDENSSKKYMKKTGENLRRIEEDYNFSRGYD